MKKFFLVLCVVLLLSPLASSQNAAAPYERATLLKMTARLNTQTRELSHSNFTDATLMSEKTVTYDFSVRSGAVRYTSRYTPPPEKREVLCSTIVYRCRGAPLLALFEKACPER
jgi:hypothetical protein